MRGGRKVTDFRFDQVYPSSIRQLSATHWTPIEVAIRAAELLTRNENTKILDVGAGCGKFCTAGALSTRGNFIGVEQRPHLVEVARMAAQELEVSNVSFIHGNMVDLDWSQFDAFYLFNPFYENKMKTIRIDNSVSFGLDRFSRYVEVVRAKLNAMRVGTQVVTYHGFGGDIPTGFHLALKEEIGSSELEMWVKVE
jgi:predicted RNA methylase